KSDIEKVMKRLYSGQVPQQDYALVISLYISFMQSTKGSLPSYPVSNFNCPFLLGALSDSRLSTNPAEFLAILKWGEQDNKLTFLNELILKCFPRFDFFKAFCRSLELVFRSCSDLNSREKIWDFLAFIYHSNDPIVRIAPFCLPHRF